MAEPDLPDRVLVVTAHPDDVDFGAAGTVATLTDAGSRVSYCIVTDGDAGGFDPTVPRDRIGGIRREEQTKAAAVVGVDDLHFLGYPDGRLQVSLELRRDLTRVIRRVRPERVLLQSPERNWQRIYPSHPDHLAAAEAAMCAVYPDSRNPFAFPELLDDEGLDAWSVPEVWVMGGVGRPDQAVDITDVFPRKLDALRCHASQLTDPDGIEQRLRAWGEANALSAGLPNGRLAEIFQAVDTR